MKLIISPTNCKNMKLNFLQKALRMSKFLLYGFFVQTLLFGLLYADHSHGQNSIDDVNVQLRVKEQSLIEVFDQLEAQTSFHFIYSAKVLEGKTFSYESHAVSLGDVLRQISSEHQLTFKRVNQSISISKNTGAAPEVAEIIAPERVFISGQVTSAEDGQPIPGVNIIEKGTTNGTTTDFDGNYRIEINEGATLLFSYIGYVPQEITVGSQSTINIVMETDLSQLEEVVVIGYGAVRKSDLTGSVARIEGDELTNLPVPRADQLLQGRLTGVNVTSSNGAPGAAASIRIRGGNSIQGDNEPLYVIDGFIAGSGFNLNNINVNDIASIEVLKDASAISIYGTRGANGVIMITTKSGAGGFGDGKPNISFNAYTGVQTILRKIDWMDGNERAAWGSEYAEVSGESNPFTDPTLIGNTDWQDVISRNAAMSNLDFAIQGNSDRVNYYFSANYFTQDGILRNSGIDRYNFRTNLDFKLSDKLKFGARINTTISNTDNDLVNYFHLEESLTTFPRFNEDGSFWDENYVTGGPFSNPDAAIALNMNERKSSNILGNFYFEFEPIENLKIRSTIGPNITWNKHNTFLSGSNPERAAANQGGFAQISNEYSVDILQENTITYSREINEDHRFDVLGGFTWQTTRSEAFTASTQGIPNDAASFDILALGTPETNRIRSSFPNPRQLVSWFGRVNYSIKDKYLFTLSGRVDGSSVFSTAENQYAFFPSAAFAWRMDQEEFIQNLNLFSSLKLRTSYGISGSQAIGALQTLATYGGTNPAILNNTVNSVVRLNRPANPELRWETTSQFDIGLEFGFFDDRLNFEVDYYYKKTEDLLLNRQIPSQTGFATRLENIGSLQNQGIELMITSTNVDKGKFKWNTMVTISANRSEVLDLGDLEEIFIEETNGFIGNAAMLIEGQPVGVFTGLNYLGTWSNQETLDNEGYTGIPARLGGPRFEDLNGDGTLSLNDDFQIIGDPEPDFFGGINNSLSYGNFTLDVFIQGTVGNDVYNPSALFGFFGRNVGNIYREALNRWTPENPDSRVPRAGTVQGVTDVPSNSELVEDGTHLRLKNVRLGYTFDNVGLSWVKNLNVYIAGSNLLLLTDFRGFDPEAVGRAGGGASQFPNVVRGFVRNTYPSARTFTIGLNANF
jgi:TonB-linked SusC/RagA family outer membrane protein